MTREEAIENIKKVLPMSKTLEDAFYTLHPELIENEDERIRKIIADAVFCNYGDQQEYLDVLAWLEKQKESIEKEYVFRPLAGTDINSAALQAIRRVNKGDSLVLAFNGAYIPVRKGCNANKIVDIYDAFIEKQKEQKPLKVGENAYFDPNTQMWFIKKEQKPTEWSEKQKKELGDYLLNMIKLVNTGAEKLQYTNDELEKYVEKCVQDIIDLCPISQQLKQKWSKEDEKILNKLLDYCNTANATWYNWLKSLPERFSLQPKQEWNEEDERRFISCMGRLQMVDGAPTNNSDWFEEHCYKHPSWKPSKEQMEAFKNSVEHVPNAYYDDMWELYEQLKKLM